MKKKLTEAGLRELVVVKGDAFRLGPDEYAEFYLERWWDEWTEANCTEVVQKVEYTIPDVY